MTRTLPHLTLATLLAMGAPAAMAQPGIEQAQWGSASRQQYQRAFDAGYGAGLREGERDARSRRAPDYRRHDEFRRGSQNTGWGWGSWNNGPQGDDAFRRGFAEGYMAAYDRHRGAYDGYGRPGAPDYGGRYRPAYPGYGGGYGGGYGDPGDRYGYSPAAQRGFEDGYRDGRDDARDRDRYEPTRKKNYREGDEGYSSRFGSREQYKVEYRQAFQQGYDRGYREGRYR